MDDFETMKKKRGGSWESLEVEVMKLIFFFFFFYTDFFSFISEIIKKKKTQNGVVLAPLTAAPN